MISILWFLLPLLVLPLAMRFIVVRLLLFFARRRLLPRRIDELEAGWESLDEAGIEAAEAVIRRRLTTLLPPVYDPRRDIEEILIAVGNLRGDGNELRFNFSVREAAEVALLAFGDIYGDLTRRRLFRMLLSVRMRTLMKANSAAAVYRRISSLPLIRELIRTRLLGVLLRLVLVPLFGVSLLLFYGLRSLTVGIVTDGSFRYLYALALLRVSYYGIYLYGGRNEQIAARIAAVRRSGIVAAGKRLEEEIDPGARETCSPVYREAAERINDYLTVIGIEADHALLETGGGALRRYGPLRRQLRRLRGSAWLAARRHFIDAPAGGDGLLAGITGLADALAEVYTPAEGSALGELRLGELIGAGYCASLLLVSRLYAAPGLRGALGKITVDMAIQIRELSEDELLRSLVSGTKQGLRLAGAAARFRRSTRLLRGRYHPVGMAVSFAAPFALAHLETSLKAGIYHRADRLLLYIWEANALKEPLPLDRFGIETVSLTDGYG